MLLYHSQNHNPYFNIAAEEYFLKNFKEDVFMLYINEPSVIVGKHQNALAEINYTYIKEQNIKVVRRLSGGGTVFHDFGNLNFCFIQQGEKEKLVDFKKFTKPILEVLHQFDVPAKLAGKSDLVIGNKKFSGNAEHVYRNKIMHHGTILYNAQLKKLSQAIQIDPFKYKDKAVKSNRSIITNVVDFMNPKITAESFIQHIFEHIRTIQNSAMEYRLTANDHEEIQTLIDSKYSTWVWNFGYSPKYVFKKKFDSDDAFLHIELLVDKGYIKQVHATSSNPDYTNIVAQMKGLLHKEAAILDKLSSLLKEEKILGMSIDNFVAQLF